MTSGKPVSAAKAFEAGLIDRVVDGDLQEAALQFAGELIDAGAGPRRTSEIPLDASHLPADYFDDMRASVGRKTRSLPAPQRIIDCVEAATRMDFDSGSEIERKAFMELMMSSESAGLRHAFFAQRQSSKIEGLASP